MDLESLKAAMEAALVASQAASADKDLQKAYAEAKKAYDDAVAKAELEIEEDPEDPADPKLDDKTKAHIAKLRKEAAGHRTKAKDLASKLKVSEDQKKAILKAAGIEEDPQDPTETIKQLSVESQQLAFRSAILESAVQHGIGKDGLEFFEFLVAKAVGELEEGEELSDEAMTAIVTKVGQGAGKGSANTSVGTGGKGGKGAPDPKQTPGEVTLAKFIRMTITEKSALYEKNRDLYVSLLAEAKAQKKLV